MKMLGAPRKVVLHQWRIFAWSQIPLLCLVLWVMEALPLLGMIEAVDDSATTLSRDRCWILTLRYLVSFFL